MRTLPECRGRRARALAQGAASVLERGRVLGSTETRARALSLTKPVDMAKVILLRKTMLTTTDSILQ